MTDKPTNPTLYEMPDNSTLYKAHSQVARSMEGLSDAICDLEALLCQGVLFPASDTDAKIVFRNQVAQHQDKVIGFARKVIVEVAVAKGGSHDPRDGAVAPLWRVLDRNAHTWAESTDELDVRRAAEDLVAPTIQKWMPGTPFGRWENVDA